MLPTDNPRLSAISTHWTVVARCAAGPDSREALAELLPRYCPAVYRYLFGILKDETAVEELCQEFAFRFVRGDFRHARPEKGRFRDYVKVSVLHLVADYRRKKQAAEKLVPFDSRILGKVISPETDPEEEFRVQCAAAFLDQSWVTLRTHSEETGQLLYAVLKMRADNPTHRSANIADRLAEQTGRSFSADGVRQLLHRARTKYAEFLKQHVAASIPSTDPDEIAAELADLGLLVYFDGK